MTEAGSEVGIQTVLFVCLFVCLFVKVSVLPQQFSSQSHPSAVAWARLQHRTRYQQTCLTPSAK